MNFITGLRGRWADADTRERRLMGGVGGTIGVLLLWIVGAALLPSGAPIGVVLIGVVLGTVTALLAMGLILIYKSNRIINFAYGSMGGVAGVLATTLFIDKGWNYYLAVLVGIVVGIGVGGLTEILVIRRFVNSSRLVLTVATIGLAQIFGGLELLIPRWLGSTALFRAGFKTPIDFKVSIGPVIFTADHLIIILAVPAVIAGLAWFLLKTDAGVAIRAASENAERALLMGIPIRRLSTIVWMVAGGLATLTFILRAPFQGTASSALAGPALLLPALAAAVVARMESLPVAFAAGISLGILEQLVLWNTSAASSVDVAFLVVILVSLLARKQKTTRAEEIGGTWSDTAIIRPIPEALRRLPEVRIGKAAVLAAVAAVAIILPYTQNTSTQLLLAVALVWGMVAISLVVLTGWGGHISLGQFAIVGCGAIAAGNILQRWSVDLFIVLLIAGLAGAAIALLVGLPGLRIRGPFLAVTTLAFAVALDSYFLNPTNFAEYIPSDIDRPVLFRRFPLESNRTMYFLCLIFLVIALLVARGVKSARAGRVLVATRENERAAGASAVPVVATKLSGFIFAGVIAGVAGGLHVLILNGAGAGTYQPTSSLEVFSMSVIGGLGSTFGALMGVFSLRLLEQVVEQEIRLLITGAGLLFILLILPGGLGQAVIRVHDWLLRMVADRRGIEIASFTADRRQEIEQGELSPEEDHPEDETAVIAGALEVPDGNGTKTRVGVK